MRGDRHSVFHGWNPTLRLERDDVLASYVKAAARAIDIAQNQGFIAGGLEQAAVNMMGTGLRCSPKPDAAALGWSQDQADKWANDVARRFEAYAACPGECDAAETSTLHQLARGGIDTFFSHGEQLALLPRLPNIGGAMTTVRVKMLPPHLLVQDNNEEQGLRQGVFENVWGAPVAYKMDLSNGRRLPDIIPRFDDARRLQVFHSHNGKIGSPRGITPFAPALQVVKRLDQLSDATLSAALIQAIFAATVKSKAPSEDLLRALQDDDEQGVAGSSLASLMEMKGEYYENSNLDVGNNGKIAHLFPDEELTFHGSQTPNDNYEAFTKMLLREIARCLGLTFEELTGDFTAATYSSVRMATSVIWPIVMARREVIPARLYQAVYEAWLEDMIVANVIAFPGGAFGFYANKLAACGCYWRGPAKPQADDLKAAKAYHEYKSMGIMSDERIAAELGFDIEDEYDQRKKELEMRKARGLPEHDTMAEPDPVGDALVSREGA
jgi:lambda family phage portal protein